eukprot:CAMPEP_0116894650 /NCGR_PEP_ID=MMETSP0467-20121206/4369_1 /TAXON_ID=283647 /ORGANISM="Mesodinium pulex, Strain SPMC105" /LENGTH=99 /DNA_ID=CAMNT_0004564983 /DNA_START=956 /DNA_END=1255 /DNA_ORIENTATION=-
MKILCDLLQSPSIDDAVIDQVYSDGCIKSVLLNIDEINENKYQKHKVNVDHNEVKKMTLNCLNHAMSHEVLQNQVSENYPVVINMIFKFIRLSLSKDFE